MERPGNVSISSQLGVPQSPETTPAALRTHDTVEGSDLEVTPPRSLQIELDNMARALGKVLVRISKNRQT